MLGCSNVFLEIWATPHINIFIVSRGETVFSQQSRQAVSETLQSVAVNPEARLTCTAATEGFFKTCACNSAELASLFVEHRGIPYPLHPLHPAVPALVDFVHGFLPAGEGRGKKKDGDMDEKREKGNIVYLIPRRKKTHFVSAVKCSSQRRKEKAGVTSVNVYFRRIAAPSAATHVFYRMVAWCTGVRYSANVIGGWVLRVGRRCFRCLAKTELLSPALRSMVCCKGSVMSLSRAKR